MLGWQFGEPYILSNQSGVLYLLFLLAIIIPTICVTARRLHDVNRSGWWQLIPITIIGLIPCIYWLIKRPVDNELGRENKWGTNPLLDED